MAFIIDAVTVLSAGIGGFLSSHPSDRFTVY